MNLSDPISRIPGAGPTLAKRLSDQLNLLTVDDFIHHYPFRYDDFSTISNVTTAKLGENVTLKGEVWSISNSYSKTRKVLTKAVFNDGTVPIQIIWFNQPWLTKNIKSGDQLQISGRVEKSGSQLSIVSPQWEKTTFERKTLNTGRLVPIYPETYGLTSKWIRLKMAEVLPLVLPQIQEFLPEEIQSPNNLIPLPQAINQIHFPDNFDQVKQARERLGFDELFLTQLATQQKRFIWRSKQVVKPLSFNSDQMNQLIKSLPFELTSAQLRVIQEIAEDIKGQYPMNRLVQGEVGSGKTVVAAVIIYLVYLNQLKTLFMAPTEILAFQHHATLNKLLNPFGISVGLYTGSRKFTQSKDTPDVIVGTHALLSDKLLTDNVGLVIVDEQQRFGVAQRSVLRSRAKIPHFLAMTATPIPRTVALTLYGDLDLSIIDELPKGRIKIQTFVVPSNKREDAYKFIDKKVKDGDQVYIVTPLIEESETLATAKAAKVEFEHLQSKVFLHLKLGLMHGKLKPKEKETVINDFKDHKLDILVSTSVVEVGVDVPNATIMVIEGAERFGLAQLHQLRGRIGRGTKESFCLLFSGNEDKSAIHRLKNLERTTNGLELSELDLKIRGSGDVFGVRQSGRLELKIATLSDLALIEKTRHLAEQLLAKDPGLDKYPRLKAKLHSISSDVMPD